MEEPTNFEKHIISTIIAMIGAIMISITLKPDSLSLLVGLIGIVMLGFGGVLEGGVK